MNLYQELLDCLEEESQALISARQEAILAVAEKKEELLDRLLWIKQDREKEAQVAAGLPRQRLVSLQSRVAAANARNREIAATSLKLVQEFLALFLPPDPGLYRPAGQAKPLQEGVFFQRRA